MKSPAFSLYVRDVLCSKTFRTLHSRPGVRGLAYLYLLCESWLEEPPATLPADHNELAMMARLPRDEWDKLWPLIESQFEFTQDGRLYNPRLMRTWEDQQERKSRGRKGGEASGEARREAKRVADGEANAQANGERVADADADAEPSSKSRGKAGLSR